MPRRLLPVLLSAAGALAALAALALYVYVFATIFLDSQP